MDQAVELAVLLSLAAGLGAFLALVETFREQESELEISAQAAVMTSSLIQPAELGAWLSLDDVLETSRSLLVELGTLLTLAAGLWTLQVQAAGLQAFQDLVAELLFALDSAGKLLLCQGPLVLFFLLAVKILTWESCLAGSLPSLVLAV